MRKRNILLLASAFAVLLGVFAGLAIADRRPAEPEETAGRYERTITDRVSFFVEPTRFTVQKTEDGEESFQHSFTLRAKKNEADFYAILHSAAVEGPGIVSVTFQTVGSDKNYVPNELPLPAEDGVAEELCWQVTVLFNAAERGRTDHRLVLHYTSGLTPDAADEHYLEIPLEINIE